MSPLQAASPRAERTSALEPAAQAPSAGHAPASNADPAGFASLLRQSQAVAVAQAMPKASAPTPTPTPAAEPAQTAEEAPRASDTGPAADAAARDNTGPSAAAQAAPAAVGKPRGATTTGAPNRSARPNASGAGKPVPEADSETINSPSTPAAGAQQADAGAAPDPALLQWIAGLQREPIASAATVARGTRAAGTSLGSGATTADDNAPIGSSAPGASRADASAGAERNGKTSLPATPAGPVFAALLAADPGSGTKLTAEPARAVTGAPDAALAAAAAAGALPAALRLQAPPPLAVAVPTPVNAPEFQQALGLQLSVLARDGVQHAELHLNPADMGPVSVQIVMDGTQARVDFGADLAATREAIEAGLPALASAMHDAGFTLAGGGVSQQSRGRGDGSDPGAGPRARRMGGGAATDAVIAGAQRAVRRTVTLGGLDLYA